MQVSDEAHLYIVMAIIIMACIFYGLHSSGLYRSCLYRHGLNRYGLYSYGLYRYGVYSYDLYMYGLYACGIYIVTACIVMPYIGMADAGVERGAHVEVRGIVERRLVVAAFVYLYIGHRVQKTLLMMRCIQGCIYRSIHSEAIPNRPEGSEKKRVGSFAKVCR